MPFPICQYVIDLVLGLPIIRGPGEYSAPEPRALNSQIFFNVEKLTILLAFTLS